MKKLTGHFFVILLLTLSSKVYSTQGYLSAFVGEYPHVQETKLNSCATCHSPVIKDFLNSYGLEIKANKLNFKAHEQLDSDKDGKTNLAEITAHQFPGTHATDSEYFIFKNKKGDVHFSHESHSIGVSYTSKGKCKNCHSKELFPKRFDDSISMRVQAHKDCWRCHRQSGSPDAPLRCKDCHTN